jgi:hypothetical protein
MSDETDLGQMRQRPGGGTQVRQTVIVRFAWRLRPGANQLGDYDAALEVGRAIVRKMIATPTTGALPIHVTYEGTPNRIEMDGGKWLLTDVRFSIDHILDLSAVT